MLYMKQSEVAAAALPSTSTSTM